MVKNLSLGLKDALSMTLERIKPLPVENVGLIFSLAGLKRIRACRFFIR